MKLSKRLLAVMMVVVMVMTLVPLGLFAFATDDQTVTKPIEISTLEQFQKIGKDEEHPAKPKVEIVGTGNDAYKVTTNYEYILKNDIVCLTRAEKVAAWLATEGNLAIAQSVDDTITAESVLTEAQIQALIDAEKLTEAQITADPNTVYPIENFECIFNGNGHKLSGINIVAATGENASKNVALFMKNSGTIKDLALDSKCTVTADVGFSFVASVVVQNIGKLSGVTSDAKIIATNSAGSKNYIGGLVSTNLGTITYTEIDESTNRVSSFGGSILFKLASDFKTDFGKLRETSISIGGITVSNSSDAYVDTSCTSTLTKSTARSELIYSDVLKGTIKIGKICGEDTTEGNQITQSIADYPDATVDTEGDKFNLYSYTSSEGDYSCYLVCKHGDVETIAENSPATCIAYGTNDNPDGDAWYHCKDCDKYYKDNTCTTNVAKEDIYTSVLAQHTLTSENELAPTCADPGHKAYYYCSVCEKYFLENPNEKQNARSYDYDAYNTYIKTPATGKHTEDPNNPGTITTQPTATTEGVKTYECSVCHQNVTEKVAKTPIVNAPSSSGYRFPTDANDNRFLKATTSKDGVTAEDFISKLTSISSAYIVRRPNGTALSASELKSIKIGTGFTIEVENSPGSQIPVVITGDVNGDGLVNISDIKKCVNHANNKTKLTGVYLIAGNVTNTSNKKDDEKIDISDIKKIVNFSLGKTKKF